MRDSEWRLDHELTALEEMGSRLRVQDARRGSVYRYYDVPASDYRPCKFCGWCPVPGRCVMSVVCPLCFALPGEHCRPVPKASCLPGGDSRPGYRQVVALHNERWMESVRAQSGCY